MSTPSATAPLSHSDSACSPDAGFPGECFHCGQTLPPNNPWHRELLSTPRYFCCGGCLSVAETIIASGGASYYLQRDSLPAQAAADLRDNIAFAGFSDNDDNNSFIETDADGTHLTTLSIEGMHCAACAWLIEHHLQRLQGVTRASVNLGNQRLHVRWRSDALSLDDIIDALRHIGYRALPLDSSAHEAHLKRQNRQQLIRLALSGLGMMQVMMLSVGLYIGQAQDMDDSFRNLLRWASMAITLPVLLYAGAPFFTGAWRGLRARMPGMDLPVAIAISGAFLASVYATLTQRGETYFDSVCMFIFFLTTSRYLEARARLKAGELASALQSLTPTLASREQADGSIQIIAARQLQIDDIVVVRPGEHIAADGIVLEGQSAVNEAMITGESQAVDKQPGDPVIAGALNLQNPLRVRVSATGQQTVIAGIGRLIEQALTEKPLQAQQADRMASLFVVRILITAVIVFAVWCWLESAEKGFWTMLAVLVATCPCALSLATPAALTVSTHRLAKRGLLITRGHVLDALATIDTAVFDKTGTLTSARFQLQSISLLHTGPDDQPRINQQQALAIAAALEQNAAHPLARAIVDAAAGLALPAVSAQQHHNGAGLIADVDPGTAGITLASGAFAIGNILHIQNFLAIATDTTVLTSAACTETDSSAKNSAENNHTDKSAADIWLADQDGPLARFSLSDQLRTEAPALIREMQQLGITCQLLSGDNAATTQDIATQLGIAGQGACTPAHKHEHVQALQQQGRRILMTGDGINDGPVLAAADVSVAMASGTDLARTAADAVLLNDNLLTLPFAIQLARATRRIIRQNLRWALLYNLGIIPFAALGWVPPWLAAIGMSLSSLLVTLNASRLGKIRV